MDKETLGYYEYEKKKNGKGMAVLAFLPGMLVLCFIVLVWKGLCSEYSYETGTDLDWGLMAGALLLLIIFHVVSAIVFIIHVIRCDIFSNGKKILWVILLLFFSILICPAYYLEYIYKKKAHTLEKVQAIERKGLFVWALLPGVVVLFMGISLFVGADAMSIDESVGQMFIFSLFLGILLLPFFHFLTAIRYIILVSKNGELSKGKKTFWVISFFLFSAIACPVYWFDYVDTKNEMKDREKRTDE